MKNKQKITQKLKQALAMVAILTLLSSVFISFMIPKSQAALQPIGQEQSLSEATCADNPDQIQCSSGSDTSFTNFEGSFESPEKTGYATGITQTSSAREFIVNVTNFVLSFLGLAAVIVIIYGGFMYVTAAGEQEKADKGKKSVTYAVIGIIIVLISFALVNTIITGAGGGGAGGDGLYASGQGTGVNSQRLRDFRAEQVDKGVKQIIEDVISSYETYINVNSIITAMVNVGQFDKSGLREMKDGFNMVMREVDSFSNTADAAQKGLLLLDRYITFQANGGKSSFANMEGTFEANVLNADFPTLPALPGMESTGPGIGEGETSPDEPVANPLDLSDPYRMGEAVTAYIQVVAQIAHEEFKISMAEQKQALLEMRDSFEDLDTITSLIDEITASLDDYIDDSKYNERSTTIYFAKTLDVSGLGVLPVPLLPLSLIPGFPMPLPLPVMPPAPPLPPVGNQPLVPAIPGFKTFTYKTAPIGGSRQAGAIIEKLNELYKLQKDLKYTSTVITSNTTQGNAPLTVTFNGLDSYDPTDISITPEQYTWDLLGDGFGAVSVQDAGNPGFAALSADNKTGPNVSYTYTTPGTYRVGLRVTSSDPANIAAGISYLSIKVNPPSSIIDLTVTGGLSNTEQNVSDKRVVSFTGEDAKAGITFNAGGTTDGDGNADTIVNFDYDFGDGETSKGENPEVIHYYTQEGTYRMELEVTDQNGVKDRKNLTIIVASPAAHLEASHEQADIGETVTFDASASLTDFGAIKNYAWTITRGNETVLDKPSGEEELKHVFTQPGTYTVTVEVTDSSGQSNATSLDITISSSAPVVVFDYSANNLARPNIVQLDGSSSYDPDKGDTLSYQWEVVSETVGTEFDFIEGTNATSKKPIIEFYNEGNHTVSLTVSDQYTGDLKQSSSLTKDIKINSILAVGVENNGNDAQFLNQEGKATVELGLSTNTGEAFEIDWNDGSAVETILTGATLPQGQVSRFHAWGTASHEFTTAGTFHVNITALDSTGKTNTLTRNVYIGNGTEPIPVVNVFIDNQEAPDANNAVGNRTNTIRFDAGKSLDLDGKSINQANSYSWVLGDGTRATGKTLTKKYDDVGEYDVTLTVRSTAEATISSSTTIHVSIIDTPPRIFGLVVQPQNESLVTPLVVKVETNARDDDGKITRYKFWYYDRNNSSETLGEQISLTPQTFLTINTKGLSGESNDYVFAVEVTDNENNTVSSLDELPENQTPTLEVENGINIAPEAKFTVDRTNVMVGETVTFTSNSIDEDGKIAQYIWDVEGDGFFNNSAVTDSTLLYEYSATSKEGVAVRLKVVDDTGATDVSDPLRIFVDSLTQDPTAAFRYTTKTLEVTFMNNSAADTSNNAELVKYEWDFDTSKDSDGDGDASNDVDSTDENPKYTYENFGRHSVKLTVTDNEGNSDSVTNVVELVELNPPQAGFRSNVVDGLNVQFTNASAPGSEEAPIETFSWDFDNDGISDSAQESPRYAFPKYGTYTVALTVTDSLGRSDDFRQSLKLEQAKAKELEAFLTTQPTGDPRRGGDIYLPGTEGDVVFSFRSQNGVGKVSYCIDKNVFFDTDGNGKKDDDCDYQTTDPGSWTTHFSKDWGNIVVKLTVKDESARVYTVTKQIFFEERTPALGTTSILPVSNMEALYILLTALGFAILGAKLYTQKESKNEN